MERIPSDATGDAIRRLLADGDRLSEPRLVDFCFIFTERKQALAFAEIVEDRDLEVCLSYYEERDMWQCVLRRYMVPTYANVRQIELDFESKAELVGGEADGWGCFAINEENPEGEKRYVFGR